MSPRTAPALTSLVRSNAGRSLLRACGGVLQIESVISPFCLLHWGPPSQPVNHSWHKLTSTPEETVMAGQVMPSYTSQRSGFLQSPTNFSLQCCQYTLLFCKHWKTQAIEWADTVTPTLFKTELHNAQKLRWDVLWPQQCCSPWSAWAVLPSGGPCFSPLQQWGVREPGTAEALPKHSSGAWQLSAGTNPCLVQMGAMGALEEYFCPLLSPNAVLM